MEQSASTFAHLWGGLTTDRPNDARPKADTTMYGEAELANLNRTVQRCVRDWFGLPWRVVSKAIRKPSKATARDCKQCYYTMLTAANQPTNRLATQTSRGWVRWYVVGLGWCISWAVLGISSAGMVESKVESELVIQGIQISASLFLVRIRNDFTSSNSVYKCFKNSTKDFSENLYSF